MAKEVEGVWRTIRGRRIFIAKGEDLVTAMKKSGKFDNLKREDVQNAKRQLKEEDRFGKVFKIHEKEEKNIDSENFSREKYKKLKRQAEKEYNKIRYMEKDEIENRGAEQAEKNRINEDAPIQGGANTRLKRNWNRYSEEQRREARHEILQDKIKAYKEKKQSNNNNAYTKEQLKEKYGTDNVDLINAGKEKENRVSLKEEKKSSFKEYTKKEYDDDLTTQERQERQKEFKNWEKEKKEIEKMRNEKELVRKGLSQKEIKKGYTEPFQDKVKDNVIPRDFKKGYGRFKIKTNANESVEDRFEITKDEYGTYHAKNLRTGETFTTFSSHLRNGNLFEFEKDDTKTKIEEYKKRKGK